MSATISSSAAAVSWDPFRVLLEDQRADCVRERELALAEAATSLPDPVAVNRAAGLLLVIEQVDEALRRMTDGTFGVCVHCGVDIPAERLEFRPFVAACVACQSAVR
jgi:DnaK suppressor protein